MTNLHVIETVERFAANGARELGWTNEDLSRRRDPILTILNMIGFVANGGVW